MTVIMSVMRVIFQSSSELFMFMVVVVVSMMFTMVLMESIVQNLTDSILCQIDNISTSRSRNGITDLRSKRKLEPRCCSCE